MNTYSLKLVFCLTKGLQKPARSTKECKRLQGRRYHHWLQTISLVWIPGVFSTSWTYWLQLLSYTFFFFLIFTFLHLNNLQTVLLKPECTNNSLGELVQTQTDFAGRLRPERLHCQDTGEADGPGPWTTLPAADFQGLWWKRSNTYWSGWMWGERTSLSRSCHLGFSLSRNALYTDS